VVKKRVILLEFALIFNCTVKDELLHRLLEFDPFPSKLLISRLEGGKRVVFGHSLRRA
jgi:hypothetical protein